MRYWPRRSADAPSRPDLAVVGGLAAAKFLLHMALAGRYGYFRDELYFLDCARRLDWGYVDHAPLVSWVAWLALQLGGSLPALRGFAALAGAGRVMLTGLIAWRLGGGRYAQGLAGLAALAAPGYLAVDGTLSLNGFEPLIWTAAAYVLVRIAQTGQGPLWAAFGLLLGVGLLNKHSTVFFGSAVAVALLLTPLRRHLRTRWPWLGALVALLVFLPNIVWQVRHDFATLEYLRGRLDARETVTVAGYVLGQVQMLHPALLPLWLAGLLWLFRAWGGRYRLLAWTFVTFYALMFVLDAKRYYLLGVYPMLLAAGATAVEAWLERRRARGGLVAPRSLVATAAVISGAVTAPVVLPVLPPEKLVEYERRLGIRSQERPTHPLFFGYQFGWPELVSRVAQVYQRLPAEERARAVILTANFGEAAAINHLGRSYDLPPAITGNLNYFLWGPGGAAGEVVISVGRDPNELGELFADVEQAAEHFHPWGVWLENRPIYLCRGPRLPLAQLWPRLKDWS